MPKPPERRVPTILFTRATSEWISRVNQSHKQLAELRVSARQRETLDRWAATEFVYSTLRLEGVSVTQEQLKRLASAPAGNEATDNDRTVAGLLAALRTVASLARQRGKAAQLTGDLLLSLHNVPGTASGFRRSAGDTRRLKPAPAENLAAMIDNACQWYAAESFTELHPVEQASIVFLRLMEMQPFEEANERTALVAASLFTLRTELPPIIIKPETRAAYGAALNEGIRMNTKPMVELIAEAINHSVNEMIQQAKK